MPFDHFMAIKFVCVDVVLCTKAMAILECQWILETKYMRQIHLKEKKVVIFMWKPLSNADVVSSLFIHGWILYFHFDIKFPTNYE